MKRLTWNTWIVQHDVSLQCVPARPVDNDAVKHIEAKADKMDDSLQTTFSNSYSCMKIIVFLLQILL